MLYAFLYLTLILALIVAIGLIKLEMACRKADRDKASGQAWYLQQLADMRAFSAAQSTIKSTIRESIKTVNLRKV